MKTTLTIRGTVSSTDVAALLAVGIIAEQRGGDPLRSVERDPRARRTALAVMFRRADGADLTAADIKTARGVVA